MPSLDISDIVFEGKKILTRNATPSNVEDLINAASTLSSSMTASAAEVEAALEVLAYLSLIPANREMISSALEASTTDASSTLSSEISKACQLALFLRLSPAYSLSATDLLELSPGRQLSGAVSFLVALLKWAPPKHQCSDLNELQAACARLFWGLTLPETLFTVGKNNLSEDETDSTPISELTSMFNSGMNELISLVLDTDILAGSIRAVKPWIVANTTMRLKMRMEIASGGFTSSSLEDNFNGSANAGELDGVFHSFVGYLLRATHNLLLFSTEAQAKLRTHISSGVVLDVFFPYTSMCTAAIIAVEDAIETSDVTRAEELKPVMQTLLSSLYASFSLLSVASFKIRILRPSLRDGRLIASALQVRSISQHVPCLAAIFSLTVNADVLLKVESSSSSSTSSISMKKTNKKVFGPKSIATGVAVNHTLKSILISCVEDLPIDDRGRFLKRLKESEFHAMPTVKTGTSFEHLREYAWPVELVSESKNEGESTIESTRGSIHSVSPPNCAITGRQITDAVIIVAKEGELNPAQGSIYREYIDKNNSESKDSLMLYYCEREVVQSAIEDAPPEGVPFTLLECERDDPVLQSVQRARLAALLDRERQQK